MLLIYQLGIAIYALLARCLSLFNSKASEWIKGRKNWRDKFVNQLLTNSKKRIWFHAASLGEYEMIVPLLEKIDRSKFEIILTFFSPSGYNQKKNSKLADYVFYLPLDTRKNAADFVKMVNPYFAVFVKYEFWYFYIRELNSKNIPVFLVSALFRKDQLFFKSYGSWFKEILHFFNKIFTMNQSSSEILRINQINHFIEAGDLRADRVSDIKIRAEHNSIIEAFIQNSLAGIAGSSWHQEEDIISQVINNYNNLNKWIIVPHDISKEHIKQIQLKFENSVLYSEFNFELDSNKKVLIIDQIGLLKSAYKYAYFAIVGGGFRKALHNIFEPAVFEIPVLFGPQLNKHPEGEDLLNAGGALIFNNAKELNNIINKFYSDKVYYNEISASCKKFINKNIGASQSVMEEVNAILNDEIFTIN